MGGGVGKLGGVVRWGGVVRGGGGVGSKTQLKEAHSKSATER